MKTYNGWMESGANGFSNYCKAGDEVEEAIVDYFLDVLPPITWTSTLMQCSEPLDHINGRATYITFKKEEGKWFYCGGCHKGSNIEAK